MSLFAILGFGLLWDIVLIGLGILLVVYLLAGKKSAKSLLFWGQAQAGEAVRAVTNTGIIAQLNQAVANGTAQIEKGKTGLSRVGGMRRSVQNQVNTAEAEEKRLMNRIREVKGSGDPNGTLTGYAEQLAVVREDLAVNRAQLTELNTQYEAYAGDIREGDRAVKDAETRAKTLQSRLEMSEAQRSMAEFANGFNPNAVTGDVAAAMKRVEDRINENLGTADAMGVGAEQRIGERKDRELERQARVRDILTEFEVAPQPASDGR